ncbi:triple functional domain protein [Lates japonicus]|uniref:Triple functional domain protein n=1 Tax=Lates japonicus TaxID=270547 RepID=A0AAD3NEI0_LATJO|nr:triple functional domain protein [Lates japonicus]
MTHCLLISESLRRFTEQRPGPSRPPPPRYSDSPLGSTPRRNPVPPVDRFQLRYPKMEVRVEATMSSGEGAEETTKDASDITPFLKTGKPLKK